MDTCNLREAYGQALVELGRKDARVVALEADLGKSTRSCLFKDEFPDRYFEMGIAEQNMTSTAAGLALVGRIPFLSTFAVFATGRAYDQIRNAVSIPRLKVRICGSSAGLSDFGDGKTHQSVEDVALMRAVPNMTVLVPVDAVETRAMMHALLNHPGPAYIRVNRNDLQPFTSATAPYAIGATPTIREGRDVVVFANGVMVSRAVSAAEALRPEGIELKVVNVSTVKPLNAAAIRAAAASARRGIVVAEEHSILGGLAAAVLEVLSEVRRPPCAIVGIRIPSAFPREGTRSSWPTLASPPSPSRRRRGSWWRPLTASRAGSSPAGHWKGAHESLGLPGGEVDCRSRSPPPDGRSRRGAVARSRHRDLRLGRARVLGLTGRLPDHNHGPRVFCGTVEATGEGVTGFARADLVSVQPVVFCGTCEHCREGLTNLCTSPAFFWRDGLQRQHG